jgi:hypothetical protein
MPPLADRNCGDAGQRSARAGEHLAKPARERFRLAGVPGLGAEEAAVVTWEHGRPLTQQLGDRRRRPTVNTPSDSSPTAITTCVGAATSASTSGR